MATGVLGVLVGGVLALVPATPAVAAAGINKQINFQGKVTNSDGTNVADGSYSFTFKLYTVSSGGTAVWTETKSLTVTAGIFQTNLGDTTALPGSVDFNTDNIYLGMSFNSDPEMSPRIRFTATPYAFNSDTLDGLDSAQFARTDASNSFTGNAQTFKNGTDSATSFQIQPAGSTTDVLDVDTLHSRVGVGLNAPAYPLDVVGDVNTSTGFRVGGVAGVSQTCSAGNYAVTSTLSGGISTGTATCFGTGSFINNQTTTQTGANFNVQSAAVGSVTGVFEDLTSQTADLVQFQDASANPMTTVDTSGYLHFKRAAVAGDNVLTARVTADANDRFTLGADGKLSFGSGGGAADVTLSRSGAGVLSSSGTLDAATKVTAPAFDTATGVALNVGTSTATSVVIGKTTTNFTLQGASGTTGSVITATSGANTTTVKFANPSANQTITLPDETGTVCLQNSANCGFLTTANVLAKNAHDTSSASYLGNLYDFSNTNTGAAGVLSLTNSGTNAALTVTQSGNPTSGQALIVANNTNATPSGNLLDLQAGGVSQLSVSASGNLVQIGGTSTTDTINGQTISAAANFTGTVTAATSFLGPVLDAATGVSLAIGNTHATAINLGNTSSNITTTINGTATVQPTSGHDSASAFVVNNASSQSLLTVDTVGNNLTLDGNNSGALQSWSTNSNALPAARWGAASVMANGYIYVLGGSTASTDAFAVNTYYYAPVSTNGSVGSWTSGTLPYVASRASAVVVNNFLYLIGGNDGTNDRTDVNFAKINADGSLGSWTSTSSLSSGRSRAVGLTTNGYIYILGGSNATTAQNTVFFAKPNANGAISSWGTTHALNTARQSASGVVANGYVYVVGGSVGNVIQYAKVNSDGTLPAFTNATTTLPNNESGATSVVANGYLYELAGSTNGTNGTSLANNYYAKLNADGSLGSFTATTSVPDNRWGATSLVANGYVYEIGGSNTSGAQSTVYIASTPRVQVGGSLDLVGLGGQTLTSGGQQGLGSTGGSITAGDVRAVGTLQVQGQANFAQGVDALGNLSVSGYGAFQNGTDSTTSFMVQNSAGNQILTVDTSGTQVVLGKANTVGGKLVLADGGSANSATIALGGTLASGQTYNLPTTGGTFCMQNASTCGFATGSGTAFVQGGNSFSAAGDLGTNDGFALNLRTGGTTRLTVGASGGLTLAAGNSLSLASGAGTITQNYSATSGTGTALNATDSASSGATTLHAQDIALTGTDNATGSNALTGLNFNNVTAHTNNTYTAINVGTGFTDLLDYNGTQIISGAGKIQNAVFDSALTYSNITGVGALVNGSIASGFGTIATANTITGTTINGTTGINTGASAGTQRIDSSGNLVNIGNITGSGAVTVATTGSTGTLALQPAAGASLTSSVTKNAATGNETAFDLSATINKATSGNYTGIKLNVTETSAPGTANKLIDLQVASASEMSVSNTGVLSVATGYQIGGAAASGAFLRGNGTNFVSSTIQAGDISGLAVLLAPTTTANNTVNPGANNAVALTLRASSNAGTPDILDVRDSSNVVQGYFDNAGQLNLSKAIVAPTSSNTINGLVINSGALSSVTSITASGTIQGATINATSGFQANGSAGQAVTCSAGQALIGAAWSEGILTTAGTCSSVSGGTFLAKNQTATESSSGSVAGDFYDFSNTNSGSSANVLTLTNSGSGNTLKVTSVVNAGSGNALIFASDTNASPSGNLIDLQAGSTPTSVFSISAAGAEMLKGGQTADLTVVSAAASSDGKSLSLLGGTAGSGNQNGGAVNITGGTGTGACALSACKGGTVNINGGAASGTGAGGLVVISAATGGSSAASGQGAGGGITLQGGNALANNNDGGSISLTAGAAHGTGKPGTVNIGTPVFSSNTESFTQTANGQTFNVAQSDLDTYGTIVVTVGGAFTGATVSLPAPTNTIAGRIVQISAGSSSASFTLSASGMTSSVNMAAGNTSTLIWNGTNWSGTTTASSLQQVYDNTSTAPAGIITTSATKNLLFQAGVGYDNANLFQIGNSLAAPVLHVDTTNTATGANLADNSGAESNPSTGWSAWNGTASPNILWNTSASNLASGAGSVDVNITTSGTGGVNNDLGGTALASSQLYNVSFNIKAGTSAPTNANLIVEYYKNNTDTTADATCTTPDNGTITTTGFFKWTCYFTTSGPLNTKSTTNRIRIRQADSAARDLYIDNLFVGAQSTSGSLNSGELQVGGPLSQGLTIFQLDSFANDPVAGAVNQNMLGSMYYSTTLGRIQCYEKDGWGSCGAAPDSNLILNPEYAGAVLNPGGDTVCGSCSTSLDASNTHIGTMTANICSGTSRQNINSTLCAAAEEFSYYQWTTSQVSSQSYSIFVKYQLPPTFGGFMDGNTIQMAGRSSDTTNASVYYTLFDNSGNECGPGTSGSDPVDPDRTQVTTSSAAWQTVSLAADETSSASSGCTFSANDVITFRVDMYAKNNATAYAGKITFTMKGK